MELRFHKEGSHADDPLGTRVGLIASLMAVALAIVTIASHRTHTKAIMDKSRANDDWSYYQATRGKYHSVELGETLVNTLSKSQDNVSKVRENYAAQKKELDEESREIQTKALADDHSAELSEQRALRYDIGEAMLEIGLVLSSLYFISKRLMFPIMGVSAGAIGAVVAVTGLMI
jgi:hypothetical protein